MRIFGYRIDQSVADEKLTLGPLDEPLFHQGKRNVGCIVLHGVAGTPANVRAVSDELIARGYTVYAPMLAGHGETVEKLSRATAKDFIGTAEAAFARLKDCGCERVFCIGLSLGALLSGILAEKKALSGLVMICPPVVMQPFLRVSAVLSAFFPFVRFDKRNPNATGDPYRNGFAGMATRKLVDIKRLSAQFLEHASDIRCPLLAVRAGLDDKTSAKSYPLLFKRAVNAPDQTLLLLSGVKHGCTYGSERERVAKAVADWIDPLAGQG